MTVLRLRTNDVTLALTNPTFNKAIKLSSFRLNSIDFVRKEDLASKDKKRSLSSKI